MNLKLTRTDLEANGALIRIMSKRIVRMVRMLKKKSSTQQLGVGASPKRHAFISCVNKFLSTGIMWPCSLLPLTCNDCSSWYHPFTLASQPFRLKTTRQWEPPAPSFTEGYFQISHYLHSDWRECRMVCYSIENGKTSNRGHLNGGRPRPCTSALSNIVVMPDSPTCTCAKQCPC